MWGGALAMWGKDLHCQCKGLQVGMWENDAQCIVISSDRKVRDPMLRGDERGLAATGEGGNNLMMMAGVDKWLGKIIKPNKCLISGVDMTMALPRQRQWQCCKQ